MCDAVISSQRSAKVLSESPMFRDYERAFTEGTGLPLRLQGPRLPYAIRYEKKGVNPFSALLAKTERSCSPSRAQGYALQCRLEEEAQFVPKTLKGFAGLCETAVPMRVGGNVIAFLHTGRVLLQPPDKAQFRRIAATLIEWGARVDLEKLEELYFQTHVLTRRRYEGLIELLNDFAGQLAARSHELILHAQEEDSPSIARARSFIADHSDEVLSLAAVARVANMSATYFSEKFRQAAGINFVDYVAHTRVGKARDLFLDPHRRVCEVAFAVGFQSLSQFNRAFRKVAGQSPKECRAALAAT